jgi:hypothetical protein
MTDRPATIAQSNWPVCRSALINTHPIQYFAPFYANLTRKSRIEKSGLYLSDYSMKEEEPGFGHANMRNVDILGDRYHRRCAPASRLAAPDPDWR